MENIPLTDIFAKMPVEEMERSLNEFPAPVMEYMPEERLRRIVPEAVRGILAQETPVIAAMAQSRPRQERGCWAGAKRIYRLVWNGRFNHHQLFKGVYRIAQRTVAAEDPEYSGDPTLDPHHPLGLSGPKTAFRGQFWPG